MTKLTMDSVIEELKGVVVLGTNGQEIDLTGITYLEFAVMLDELFQGEVNQLLNAIVDKIGEEELTKVMTTMEELAEEEADKAEEDIHFPKEEESTQNTKPIVLDPIKMASMDNTYTLDPDEFAKGIVSVSEICGRYTALVNSGLTNSQAYEIATMDLVKQCEMEVLDKQIELKKLELDTQVRINGVQRILGKQ